MNLKELSNKLLSSKQGSSDWIKLRLGVLTASEASKLLADPTTDTFKTYILNKASEVITKQSEPVTGLALEWGKENEAYARSRYSEKFNREVLNENFIFLDDKFKAGCSPDGIVFNDRLIEIKCPFNSTNHIKSIMSNYIKPEYKYQMQFQMLVTGLSKCDFVSYDPRCGNKDLHVIEVLKDEAIQLKLRERILFASEKIDEILIKFDVKFGSQWT